MLAPNHIMESYTIPTPTLYPGNYPRWSDLQSSTTFKRSNLGGGSPRRDADVSSRPAQFYGHISLDQDHFTTIASTIIAAITTLPEPTRPGKNVNPLNIAAIVGGAVGGLGFVALVCAAIAFYRLSIRKTKPYPPANRGPDSPLYGTGGVIVAITQTSEVSWSTSTGRDAGSRVSTPHEFGMSLGAGDRSKENPITYTVPMVPSDVIADAPTSELPLNIQGPEYSLSSHQPPRNSLLRLEPSPIASSTDSALSEDSCIAYGVPTTDEKQTGLGGIHT